MELSIDRTLEAIERFKQFRINPFAQRTHPCTPVFCLAERGKSPFIARSFRWDFLSCVSAACTHISAVRARMFTRRLKSCELRSTTRVCWAKTPHPPSNRTMHSHENSSEPKKPLTLYACPLSSQRRKKEAELNTHHSHDQSLVVNVRCIACICVARRWRPPRRRPQAVEQPFKLCK